MKKMISGVLSVTMMALAGYAVIGVATTTSGLQNAEARRLGGSSFSRGFSRPSTPTRSTPAPAVTPKPAPTNSGSMIGSNVKPVPAKPAMATNAPTVNRAGALNRPVARPVPRVWHSSPAQRASAGSSVRPFLLGMGGAIAGSMLYNWLTSPTMGVAHAANTTDAKAATSSDGLNIIKPQGQVKVFEGIEIPAEYQEKMKANGVSVEAKKGPITEYSKTIKVKGGVEVKIDVAELPVLVIYENVDGKLVHDLYVPI